MNPSSPMKTIPCLLIFLSCPAFATETPSPPQAITSLKEIAESHKLPGGTLTALAEKILYKKTPQGDLYLYLLRPPGNSGAPCPPSWIFTADPGPAAAWTCSSPRPPGSGITG